MYSQYHGLAARAKERAFGPRHGSQIPKANFYLRPSPNCRLCVRLRHIIDSGIIIPVAQGIAFTTCLGFLA